MTKLPQGYAQHEIPADYAGSLFLESQMRAFAESETARLRGAARLALEFCEFCWRDVSLNDYAEEHRSAVENALRAALGEDK